MKNLTFTLLFSLLAVSAFAQQAEEEVRLNQYGARVDRMPLTAEARNGILVFESPKQDFRFWFDVRVQVDGAVFFEGEDWMDPIGNNASIRRARIGIKSQITKNWTGEIDTDFANGAFELKDALLRYTTNCGNLRFTAGNFKEDFSMEQTTSSRYLTFMERPMAVQTFAPSRHIGIDARFRQDWFYASIGTFFQLIEGAEAATWVEDAEKDSGYNQGMSYTAKMVFNPLWKHKDAGIHLGLGGSYRTPKTDADPREYDGFRYSSRNATSINRKKYLDTGRHPGVTDFEFLWNAELAGHYRGFRFQSEYIQMNNFLKDNLEGDYAGIKKYTFGGWYAMAGIMLFGGEQQYNLGESEFTQPTRGRKWGDVELVARYDYMSLNDKTVYGGAGQNYTFGINYYVNSNVKFVFNYQYSSNDRYANAGGDHFIGLDAQGNPTTDYTLVNAAKGKAGVRYHMLGIRMEVDF